jgi:hypothetical protein
MIRHLLQIFFTLGLTFISVSFWAGHPPGCFVLLVLSGSSRLPRGAAAAARWMPYL